MERTRADGERLIEVAAAHPDALVPCCPDWDGMGLLSHMTRVWHMLALFAETKPDDFPARELFPARPADGEEVAGAHEALDRVVSSMTALQPGVPMWSWAQTHSSDYFHRRVHLETLVHRVDAEQAAGFESDIDGDEAADALDERFIEFLPIRTGSPSGSLHVHRTDGEGEWTMRAADGVFDVDRSHSKGDAAARGSGADLMLAMWGRGTLEPLEVFGDAAIVDEWFELCR